MPADDTATNRRYWDEVLADWFATRARRHWAADEPVWGMWNIPQIQMPILPADVAGQNAVELGCGTAYVSAWPARRGASPIGVYAPAGGLHEEADQSRSSTKPDVAICLSWC
jgi:hypothetical protein